MKSSKKKSAGNFLHEIILGILVSLSFLYFTTLSFLRYDNFYTGRYDLGNMTQVVWNSLHGRIFQQTNPDGIETVSRLAFHADFILILFTPLYLIWESPKVLLLSQALIVSLGAIFIFLIAKELIKNKTIAFSLAFSFLINPSVGWSTLFDFHPVVLATTFLLGAFYFLIKKDYRWFLIFGALSVSTKEQVWFVFIFFGLILFFFHNKRLLGSVIISLSSFMFYFLIWHAIPWAASSQGHFAISYFENAGGSPSSLLMNIFNSPVESISKIFLPEKIEYIKSLFSPLGYLPLLFPFGLIPVTPDLMLNVLADKEELHQIYYHYTAVITPFLFICSIYTIYFFKKIFPRFSNIIISLYIIIFAVFGAFTYGPLLLSQTPNDEMLRYPVPNSKEISEKLKEIPQESSVAASNELGAQLSHRENIYTLGIEVLDADYIAFFTRNPDPSEEKFNNQLKEELKNNPDYDLWYKKYNVTIFKKIY